MPRAIATKQYHDFTGGLNTDSTKLNFPENSLVDVRNIIIDKSGKLRRAKYGEETATGQTIAAATGDPHAGTFVWNSPNGIAGTNFLVVQYGENLYFYDLDYDDASYEVSDNYVGTVAIDLSMDEDELHFTDIDGRLVVVADGGNSGVTQPQYITYTSPSTFATTNFSMEVRDLEGINDGYRVEEQKDYSGDCWLILTSVTGTYAAPNTINGSTSGVGVGTIVSWTAGTNVVRVTTTTKLVIGETITDAISGATGTLAIQVPVMGDYVSDSEHNHLYNLYNQGWTSDKITTYTIDQGKEPSNAMQWILGKDTSDVFDPDLLDKQFFGTAQVPKGRITYDLRLGNRRTSYIENDITVIDDLPGTSPDSVDGADYSTVASAVGRLWLAGGNKGNKNVYFSQIIKEDLSNLTKAYQEQDPTAEDFNDLLDTDGGAIPIKGADNIIKLLEFQNGVLVLANNGVWFISAPDTGFTPTNYSVRKITSFGVSSSRSVIKVSDSIFYWSYDGIILLAPDPESGYLTASEITAGKVNQLYTGKQSLTFTPTFTDKTKAWGAYDNIDKKIYWGYDQTASSNKSSAQKIMVLDLDLGSFTFLDAPNSVLHGAFNREHDGIKFLYLDKTTGVVAEFINLKGDTFLGTTANCYFETFHENLGDTVRDKAATWVLCQFERTEDGYQTVGGGTVFTNPSGCNMRAKWEWTDHTDANRWSSSEQVYRLPRLYVPTGASDPFDYGHTVITTKNKVRGHGKAISLRFEAEADKDFVLLGWAAVYTGSGTV